MSIASLRMNRLPLKLLPHSNPIPPEVFVIELIWVDRSQSYILDLAVMALYVYVQKPYNTISNYQKNPPKRSPLGSQFKVNLCWLQVISVMPKGFFTLLKVGKAVIAVKAIKANNHLTLLGETNNDPPRSLVCSFISLVVSRCLGCHLCLLWHIPSYAIYSYQFYK